MDEIKSLSMVYVLSTQPYLWKTMLPIVFLIPYCKNISFIHEGTNLDGSLNYLSCTWEFGNFLNLIRSSGGNTNLSLRSIPRNSYLMSILTEDFFLLFLSQRNRN